MKYRLTGFDRLFVWFFAADPRKYIAERCISSYCRGQR